MATAATAHARSLYRSLLRELPARTPTVKPSPIRDSIRQHFLTSSSSITSTNDASSSSPPSEDHELARRQEAEQFVQYLRAQRIYGELLERYNPGMNMDEEERVRLTARRVGMDLPQEWKVGSN